MRWQKHILGTHPDLPPHCKRYTLIAYCLAMAVKGRNGLGCFASDEVMGEELGIANRAVVAKYHHAAVEVGWLAWNGKRRGRAKVLDISFPQVGPDIVSNDVSVSADASFDAVVADEPPEVDEHDHGQAPATCPACQPLIAQVVTGDLTMAQLLDIHAGMSTEED
jgi:hypothetical protein